MQRLYQNSTQQAMAAPQRTLLAFALGAIAGHLGQLNPATPEEAILQEYLSAMTAWGDRWHDCVLTYLDDPAQSDRALIFLAQRLQLTVLELLACALAAAVESDPIVGRLLAHVQAPIGGARPTAGLLATTLAGGRDSFSSALNVLVSGQAVSSGLLALLDEETPLPERALRMPLPLCLALGGADGEWSGVTVGMGAYRPVPLPPSIDEMITQHAVNMRQGQRTAVVIRSGNGDEGRTVAAQMAAEMGFRAAFLDGAPPPGFAPWLMLRALLPVICHELTPGERHVLPPFPAYDGPMLLLCGGEGAVEITGYTTLSWTLPVPPPAEREQLWLSALGDQELAADLARYHRHRPARIATLARLAQQNHQLTGQNGMGSADLLAAAWLEDGSALDTLAEPLRQKIGDDALVTGTELARNLEALRLRCRARDGLVDALGASAAARYHPGVRVLFVGPSGTGKTLAAGWLATKLDMPLYRVDMASVTSKYIGETEKNLSQLLLQAEQTEVILLFDEADALFGKRTEVSQANDRFANAQTNYLLERIETFDGIAILTSNSRSRFDTAFTRRLDLIVEFPLPGPKQRRQLWLAHLGDHHTLTRPDLNKLSASADITGGNIRNVVLAAAVLAQEEGGKISYTQIIETLESEYRKLNRRMPVALNVQE